MALELAEKFTACSNCEVPLSKEPLYKCMVKSCSKFGESFCEECGKGSHKRKDHAFDINEVYIKPITTNALKKNINHGSSLVKQTMTAHYETKYGENRRAAEAAASTIASLGGSAALDINGILSVGGLQLFGSGPAFMATSEIITHTMRFCKGEITTWKEYGYHIAKGMSATLGMATGQFGGLSGAYAAFQTLAIAGSPITGIIAIAISACGSVLGAKLARSVFDAFWPDNFIQNQQCSREEMIKNALELFFLDIKHIDNPEIFNEKTLKKTYHALAKKYHPDKNGGSVESHQKFHEINVALGVLLALLEKDDNDKTQVVQTLKEMRAIKWKKDIKELSKTLKEKKLMYIVDICTQWDSRLTMEFLSKMNKQDIIETVNKINSDTKYKHQIDIIDKNQFAEIVENWAMENGFICTQNNCVSNPTDIEEEQESKCDDDDDNIIYDEIEELRDALRQKKVLDIATICEEYDADLTLEALLEYRKKDILELIDEINNDESNKHKISVSRKNKFAKIIHEFAEKQCEPCLAK